MLGDVITIVEGHWWSNSLHQQLGRAIGDSATSLKSLEYMFVHGHNLTDSYTP